MPQRWLRLMAICGLTGVVAAGAATTVTDTFDGTIDQVPFRLGAGDRIVAGGGNPGSFLENDAVQAGVPVIAGVQDTSRFNYWFGPWRVYGVDGIGIDVKVAAVSAVSDNRPVSLGLRTGSCEIVLPGKAMPVPGAGWRRYDFAVPAWKTRMPAQWTVSGACAGTRDDVWNSMMQSVGEVRFYVGDPAGSYPSQLWSIGIDNARIVVGKFGA